MKQASVSVTGGGGVDLTGEDHSLLDNLDFASSGHTGFASSNAIFPRQSGFPNRTQDGTIFFDIDGSIGHQGTPRTFYIYGTFSFQVQDENFSKTLVLATAEYFQIPDVSGIHYIVYDSTGTLQEITALPPDWENIFYNNCYVAAVYWNATNSELIYFGDERHGVDWPWAVHTYEHTYERTQYDSGLGLAIEAIDQNGDDPEDVRLAVANGQITDEDLEWAIVDGSPQDLTPIAQIPVFFRSGATEWRIKEADDYPLVYSDGVYFTGANGRVPYNQFTGGVWQLTEVGNADFVLIHIVATNDKNHPIVAIQGQADYATLAQARDGSFSELSALILAGLPFEEFRFLGTIIFQTSVNYTNVPQARTRTTTDGDDYVDWRTEEIVPFGVQSVPAHASLIGLDYASAGHTGFLPDTTLLRERLSAARTYYVRTDGNDSNTGLVNDAAGAFLTLQAAVNAYQAIDCNGYDVTIQVADGTYNTGAKITSRIGTGSLYITGNVASPANCYINRTTGYTAAFHAYGHPPGSDIFIDGFKLKAPTCIYSDRGSVVYLGNIIYDVSTTHIQVGYQGIVVINGNYEVIGNASRHIALDTYADIVIVSGKVATFTGSIAFSTVFLKGDRNSIAYFTGTYPFVGSPTGKRFALDDNSIIYASGNAETFLPGDAAGTATRGSDFIGNRTTTDLIYNGGLINSATDKASPVDADYLGLMDSEASNVLKKLSVANLKVLVAASGGRERLVADRTYYVRTDGDDGNTGLVNNAAGAFLTVQFALDHVRGTLDLSIYNVTISTQAGTFTENLVADGPHVGAGRIILQGVGSTTILTSTTGNTLAVSHQAVLQCEDFKISSTAGNGFNVYDQGMIVESSGIEFGACAGTHCYAVGPGSFIEIIDDYSITGAAAQHWIADFGGAINVSNLTLTITGTPAFTRFAWAYTGLIFCAGITFSGSATGQRFRSENNGVIETQTLSYTYLPGNSAGAQASGGIYNGTAQLMSDVAHSAGNFTASTGTWTVASGDQATFSYIVVGNLMTIVLRLNTTTLSDATTWLYVAIPGGYEADGAQGGVVALDPHGLATEAGQWYVDDTDTVIGLKRLAADMPAGADATYVTASIVLKVAP